VERPNEVNYLISGFRHNVDEICALLGYYAASCGNCLLTFWDNVSVTMFMGQDYINYIKTAGKE
jgi:hypothetical protein